MKRVVIIGGVAGGATSAARLRRLREDFEIIILEKGQFVSFANCGLPYFIGNVIKKQSQLELMTPKKFFDRFNIDVRVQHEALSIDNENKIISIKNNVMDKEYTLEYDYLILSPGASPIVPNFDGITKVPIFTLRTIPDSVKIKHFIEKNKVKHATIIGGGYIGLEMAENLHNHGIKVKIIEMLDQVLAPIDREVAQFIHQELILNGVCLQLGDAVDSFECENQCNYVILKSGKKIKTDMIIMAIGVKPETILAKEASLKLSNKGYIIVNEHMQTSDPSIYAVGDAVQIKNFISQDPTSIPLAGPANKQGRIAADNIAGRNSVYKGIFGNSVLKIFDLTVSFVGLSEKQLKNMNIDYNKIYIHPYNHAGYYPGAIPITIKLIFEIPSGKILGAQAIGGPGTEKRIDVISTVIKFGGSVFDLEELELSYAPPYGSAKDPVNMAGFVASNVLKGDHPIWHWDELNMIKKTDNIILDVRTPKEYNLGTIEGSININDLELRDRLNEIPKDKSIFVFCDVGFRAYLVTRFLLQKGYDVKNLSGGFRLYKIAIASTEDIAIECGQTQDYIEEFIEEKTLENNEYMTIDASGLPCPGPLNTMIKGLEDLPKNKRLKIYATDPGFKSSVEAYVKLNNQIKLLHLGKEEGKLVVILEKGDLTSEDIKAPILIKKKTRKELRGVNVPTISEISVEELYNRIDSDDPPKIIIDVRTPQEYYGPNGHIEGTKLIPLGDLISNLDQLEEYKDEEVVVICHSGARSMMATQLLERVGFIDIRNLTGGMMNWHKKGYNTET